MAECCDGSNVLVYACSGSSDLGEIADRAARKLRNSGFANMSCIAGIGAGLSGYVESAKGSDKNIAIDGCKVACVKRMLDKIGADSISYILTEMGHVKGKTPPTDEIVTKIADTIMKADFKETGSKKPLQSGGSCNCGGKC